MELVAVKYDESFVGEIKVKSQPRTKTEINKALTLLGFNSWTAVEPSKSLKLFNRIMSSRLIYLSL